MIFTNLIFKTMIHTSLFIVLFCACALVTGAQIQTGTQFVGGGILVSAQKAPENGNGFQSNYSAVNILPVIGFILNERWAIGSQIGVGFSNQESRNGTQTLFKSNSKGITMAAVARRYFPLTEKFFLALDGRLQFDRGSEMYSSGTSETTSQSYEISSIISPVFIFFPTNRWGFEASIGSISYGYYRNLSTDSSSNNFGLNYGSVSLGIAYYFQTK